MPSVSDVAVLLLVLTPIAFIWLIRSLVKMVVDKASAEDLPKVLESLAPLLTGVARVLSRRPPTSRVSRDDEGSDRTLEP